MSTADAGQHWLSECAACRATFRDSFEQAGVCPKCNHENYDQDGEL